MIDDTRREMTLQLKEMKNIESSSQRRLWVDEPWVNKYVELRDSTGPQDEENSLTNFNRYYEIYQQDIHVGDIKVFYENEEDVFKKRAQILMVVGKPNEGIGTTALGLLLNILSELYNSAYCTILRSNIASLKILKKHQFIIDRMDGDTIRLVKEF